MRKTLSPEVNQAKYARLLSVSNDNKISCSSMCEIAREALSINWPPLIIETYAEKNIKSAIINNT